VPLTTSLLLKTPCSGQNSYEYKETQSSKKLFIVYIIRVVTKTAFAHRLNMLSSKLERVQYSGFGMPCALELYLLIMLMVILGNIKEK